MNQRDYVTSICFNCFLIFSLHRYFIHRILQKLEFFKRVENKQYLTQYVSIPSFDLSNIKYQNYLLCIVQNHYSGNKLRF